MISFKHTLPILAVSMMTDAHPTNHESFWGRVEDSISWIDHGYALTNETLDAITFIDGNTDVYYANTGSTSNLTAIIAGTAGTCFVSFGGVEYFSNDQYQELDERTSCPDVTFLGSSPYMEHAYPNAKLSGLETYAGYRCDYLEFAHDSNFVDALSSCQADHSHVIFTGHALGGAAARLMAEALRAYANDWDMYLYTFGSPRLYWKVEGVDDDDLGKNDRWVRFIATLSDATEGILYDKGMYFTQNRHMFIPLAGFGGQYITLPPSDTNSHGVNLRFAEDQIEPTHTMLSFDAGTIANYRESISSVTSDTVHWEGFAPGVGCFSYELCAFRCQYNKCSAEFKLPCNNDDECMGADSTCYKGTCSECEVDADDYDECPFIDGSGCKDNDECLSGRCETKRNICKAKKVDGDLCNEDSDCINKCQAYVCSSGENGQKCESNEFCDSNRCADDRTCQDKLPSSSKCVTDNDCSSGRCDMDKDTNKRICHDVKPNGAKCNENSDCDSRRCEGQKNGSKGRCQARLANGRSCNEDSDCTGECRHSKCSSRPTGLWEKDSWCRNSDECVTGRCDNSKCSDRLALASKCSKDNDCESVICRAKRCSERASSGSSKLVNDSGCRGNDDCLSGRCDGMICLATLSNGSGCNEDSDCSSGRCHGGSKICRPLASKGKNDSCSYSWECKKGRNCRGGKCK